MLTEKFQSTPPSREATEEIGAELLIDDISIHAPLTGGDTNYTPGMGTASPISIHAPLTGGDPLEVTPVSTLSYFNPRPPHGRRRFL